MDDLQRDIQADRRLVAASGARRSVDYLMRPKRIACKADPDDSAAQRWPRLPMSSDPQAAPRKLTQLEQPYGFTRI